MAADGIFGRGQRWLAGTFVLIAFCGCSGAPNTLPVKGKLVFENGDIALLAGSALICQRQQEPFFQAYGEIQADGSFQLKTRCNGEILRGAVPGNYRAWIELSTDNGSKDRLARELRIDRRYLSQDGLSSPLIFIVPSPAELVLTVTEAQAGDLPEVTPPWAAFPRCGEPNDPEAPAGEGL